MERYFQIYRDALIGKSISQVDFGHGSIIRFEIKDIRPELTDGVSYIRMISKDAQFELLVLTEIVDSLIEKGKGQITAQIGNETIIQEWHLIDSAQK